ncbi:Glyoxalase-like domain protein [Roseovarius sp. THAF9]|uniref:glyoxalase superfamily protein n=1 Tax=Roseovarius sp. THAF9 TaxID=2587847 RepID=UPI001267A915|nr:glyoxalase superfamily protein [Roseovarius sp. THAF9]QFT93616.1 Glyoxalase-like domain protein [Roseovarius sp. THAF9]
MTPQITRTAPVFRSFDEARARAFYVDWLGFDWTGEVRVFPGAAVYAFLRLGDFHLHLTEHHGDATPGSTAMVHVDNLRDWHATLPHNPNMRPGLEPLPWGLQMEVTDPFGNRLRFLDQGDDA